MVLEEGSILGENHTFYDWEPLKHRNQTGDQEKLIEPL